MKAIILLKIYNPVQYRDCKELVVFSGYDLYKSYIFAIFNNKLAFIMTTNKTGYLHRDQAGAENQVQNDVW